MAGYGTVAAYARLLGDRRAEKLLLQSLEEEKEADKLLSGIAETCVNLEAEMAGRN